jgi:small ligand-binding sensory domain FIST
MIEGERAMMRGDLAWEESDMAETREREDQRARAGADAGAAQLGARAGQAVRAMADVHASAAVRVGESWDEAVRGALAGLELAGSPDVALVFIDSRFEEAYSDILGTLRAATGARHIIGCSGQAVIGPGVEAEALPGVAIMTLQLPAGAELSPVPIVPDAAGRIDLQALNEARADAFFVFADPYSVNPEALLTAVETRHPGSTIVGGMASSHQRGTGTALFLDGDVHDAGAVLLGLRGVRVVPVVAQGAEPLGETWTITACHRNTITSIGGKPALDVMQQTLNGLDPDTRRRAARNMLAGLALNEYRDEYGRGDFLIRNLTGLEPGAGGIVINAVPKVGQTFQFQFRDARAASEDLRSRLSAAREHLRDGETVIGALLCTCNGRGVNLFGTPDHDAGVIADLLGDVPVAGLFCAGEIGPVGGKTFVHGFTASIALLVAEE